MKITNILLKTIPDSRGNLTLEAEMETDGVKVLASAPSGKSRGKNEAKNIPPEKALGKIDWIKSQIKGHEFATLEQFDSFLLTLDGTEEKAILGANLILVLSIAFLKLLAKKGNLESYEIISKISGNQPKMPLCFFNLINGGAHAENSLPFQEYLSIPKTNSPQESLEQVMVEIKNLGERIQEKYGKLKQGDEGGYIVPSSDPAEGLKLLLTAITASARPGLAARSDIGLDVAASSFYQNGSYNIGDKVMNVADLLSLYKLLTKDYQLFSIEDPFQEEDFESFSQITLELGEETWIIGDDLTTTNIKRIKEAHEKNAINAVIIKLNQIGSVSEAIQAANLAKSYGWKIIVSHRSGETMDTFIADLAVGLGADGFKAGCPLQKERLVKYERLVEIERRLS